MRQLALRGSVAAASNLLDAGSSASPPSLLDRQNRASNSAPAEGKQSEWDGLSEPGSRRGAADCDSAASSATQVGGCDGAAASPGPLRGRLGSGASAGSAVSAATAVRSVASGAVPLSPPCRFGSDGIAHARGSGDSPLAAIAAAGGSFAEHSASAAAAVAGSRRLAQLPLLQGAAAPLVLQAPCGTVAVAASTSGAADRRLLMPMRLTSPRAQQRLHPHLQLTPPAVVSVAMQAAVPLAVATGCIPPAAMARLALHYWPQALLRALPAVMAMQTYKAAFPDRPYRRLRRYTLAAATVLRRLELPRPQPSRPLLQKSPNCVVPLSCRLLQARQIALPRLL